MRAKARALEEVLADQCALSHLPEPVREHRFAPPRRWRFDLAWPAQRVACEVEGGTWVYGRHNRPSGYESDKEKYNEAAVQGWRVIGVTSAMVYDGRALGWLERLLRD